MRHRSPRPPRSAAVRASLTGTARGLARFSGLLVLTLALLAATGIGYVVHGQAADGDRVPVAVASLAGTARPATGAPAAGREQEPATRAQREDLTATAANGAAAGAAGAGTTPRSGDAATATATATASAADAPRAGHHHSDQRRQTPEPDAAPGANCTLTVPQNPTSAAGLATPYRLASTDPRAGACHETTADQSAFVEAAIIQPSTGKISIYHPLVVDEGAVPAAAPVAVSLPAGAVVGVWFGFNGDTLTLAGPGAGECVNGLPGSPFGQFAYCNASAFFQAAQNAIAAHTLVVPGLGTGKDGLPCPTTRDFAVVDQDQSDNLATAYRVVNGRVGQDTAANRGGQKLTNGSDEGLLANAIDKALGCTPFTAPDLTDPGTNSPALALNELSAAAYQAQSGPEALVPVSDPMVQVGDRVSQDKTNLYRAGVDQPPLPAGQDPETYCRTVRSTATMRLARDAALFRAAPSPSAAATDLLDFLRTRLDGTLTTLGCRAG